MNTPYGLASLWTQGDFVIRGTALALLLMSLISWSIITTKAWQIIGLRKMARPTSSAFWQTKNFEDGLTLLVPNHQQNPFYSVARDGLEAIIHHTQYKDDLQGSLNTSDWITRCLRRSIDEASAQLQTGLAWLASIGSTAPFIGLFGTVWGIYHALIGIGIHGQASIDKVAGPVGEALIMTAFGLAVAIPAVLGYNTLSRGNREILAQLHHFADDLHAYLLTGGRLTKIRPKLVTVKSSAEV